MDGGNKWDIISPDLSRQSWDVPASVGIYAKDDMKKMPRRGVIYTVAPSYVDINTIWCGTDDGLIHVTKDGGKTWTNVTPPQITSWSKVSLMDASHTDANTAYAAVNKIRLDDMKPHIYKTTDGGKTWSEIVNGLPDDPINVVKEDPVKKGLLFAGSERAVYVSFDDGANWQSLRLNMPATSIRDLVIKDDDIVVGTHGRSFWILDDITSLRQINNQLSNQPTILYKPQTAYRVRWNMNPDTPIPQEEPAGQNPPDGAVINYYLEKNAGNISLEILDDKNNAVRKYSSADTMYKIGDVNIPDYWIRPQQILSGAAGSHRFMWDMHYAPLNVPPSYPISATYMNTAPDETSPWVLPGMYTAKLTVDGKTTTQNFEVKMDPRVKTSDSDLKNIYGLDYSCYNMRQKSIDMLNQLGNLHLQIKNNLPKTNAVISKQLNNLDSLITLLERNNSSSNLNKLNGDAARLFGVINDNDMPPTLQAKEAVVKTQADFAVLLVKWENLNNEIKKVNAALGKTKLPLLK